MYNINKSKWPHKTRDVSSAWRGLEDFVLPIIQHFNVTPNIALEFGVDHGYSSDIFSQVFNKVIGVDSFIGDAHIIHEQGEDFFNKVKLSFANSNVEIIRSSFEDFILNNTNFYDLIHIDIVHHYEPTFKCAEWAIQHSNLVILHDTISYPEIYNVCRDISSKHDAGFYNIVDHFGLGILYKK